MDTTDRTRLDSTILNNPDYPSNTMPPMGQQQPGMAVPPPFRSMDEYSSSVYSTDPMTDDPDDPNNAYPANESMDTASMNAEEKSNKKNVVAGVAAGVGGVALGAGAVLLSSFAKDDNDNNGEEGSQGGTAGQSNLADQTTDGEIPIAHSVTEDMSFNEAFAAARAEVGPGGAFSWHGQVYSTYTAAEWNAMSEQQQDAFNDHFTFFQDGGGHHSASSHNNHVADNSSHNNNTNQQGEDNNDDGKPGDNPGGKHNDNPGDEPEIEFPYTVNVNGEDIEVLNIDQVQGHVVARVNIADVPGVLVDGDDDGVFDVLGADFNGDSDLSDDEFVDLQANNIHIGVAQILPPTEEQAEPAMADSGEVLLAQEDGGNDDDVVVADPDGASMPPVTDGVVAKDGASYEPADDEIVEVETDEVTVLDPDDASMPAVTDGEPDYDVAMDSDAAMDMSGDDVAMDNAADMSM